MPLFTYTTNIPATNNNPSTDQPDMKINTNSTNSILGVDLYSFNNSNGGWHKQVTLPIPSPFVMPPSKAAQSTIYTNTAGQTQLFATTDAGGKAYQLTRFIDASFAEFGADVALTPVAGGSGSGGWTFLPGGLLLQYGFCTNDAVSGGDAYNFPVQFTSTPFSVVATAQVNDNNSYFTVVETFSNTSFTVVVKDSGGSSKARSFSWIAIGV